MSSEPTVFTVAMMNSRPVRCFKFWRTTSNRDFVCESRTSAKSLTCPLGLGSRLPWAQETAPPQRTETIARIIANAIVRRLRKGSFIRPIKHARRDDSGGHDNIKRRTKGKRDQPG